MPGTTITSAPSDSMPATRASTVPSGTSTVAARPSNRAMWATARPWLPSVAATNRSGPRRLATTAARSSGVDHRGSPPSREHSTRYVAHDAPRILKDGSPSRLDSSLTSSRWGPPTPSGSPRSGVGA